MNLPQFEYEKSVRVDKTVKEVWEALDKNGFEWLRGDWMSFTAHPAACALGQAALNLGIVASTEAVNWNSYEDGEPGEGIYEEVERASINSQLNRFKVPKDSRWISKDMKTGWGGYYAAGETITHWNDLQDSNEEYVLKTYEEVSQMAYEILEPFFDEVVTLRSYDYQMPKVGA